MSNISLNLKQQERKKIKQQERLLIELAKEFRKLLLDSGKTEDELKLFLGQNDAFITGIKHGFGNIRIRELADIFTFFDKKVLLKSVGIGEEYQIVSMENSILSCSMKRPQNISSDIVKVMCIGINDRSEPKGQAMVFFDKNSDTLEMSEVLEHTMRNSYQTIFKHKMELRNEN